MRSVLSFICFVFCVNCFSQTLGGAAAYNFLKLSPDPLVTAAGGVLLSYKADEAGLGSVNPALLQSQMSGQLNTSFTAFLGGIKTYALTGCQYINKWSAAFGAQVYYVDYGSVPLADAAGNVSGYFRPVDFTVQVSAAKKYLDKWTYGCTVKAISSSYPPYSSRAVAVDIGILFSDSSKNFSASLLAKNMGWQLKTYAGQREDLPFDLEVGVTKRLAKAPFGFSLTAQHLHRPNTTYNDAAFNNDNNLRSSSSAADKIFNHFILAMHIYLAPNLEATIGYNHLKRTELSLPEGGNGLSGFSGGFRIKFSKLQILYARAAFQHGFSYNQIGIAVQLNKVSGLGK